MLQCFRELCNYISLFIFIVCYIKCSPSMKRITHLCNLTKCTYINQSINLWVERCLVHYNSLHPAGYLQPHGARQAPGSRQFLTVHNDLRLRFHCFFLQFVMADVLLDPVLLLCRVKYLFTLPCFASLFGGT